MVPACCTLWVGAFSLVGERSHTCPLSILPDRRAGKFAGSAHFTLRSGRQQGDGLRQLPLVALVLSLPEGGHQLLSHSQASTLFHEFGHALHSLLSKTQFQHLSGAAAPCPLAGLQVSAGMSLVLLRSKNQLRSVPAAQLWHAAHRPAGHGPPLARVCILGTACCPHHTCSQCRPAPCACLCCTQCHSCPSLMHSFRMPVLDPGAGTRGAMDIMEVPSHFYQMYASDPTTLQMFARHFQSGESVPPALIDRLLIGLRAGSALSLQEQVSAPLSLNALHPPRPTMLQALIIPWLLRLPGEQVFTSLPACMSAAHRLQSGPLVAW